MSMRPHELNFLQQVLDPRPQIQAGNDAVFSNRLYHFIKQLDRASRSAKLIRLTTSVERRLEPSTWFPWHSRHNLPKGTGAWNGFGRRWTSLMMRSNKTSTGKLGPGKNYARYSFFVLNVRPVVISDEEC